MKATVIIPTLQRPDKLHHCLKSLLKSSYDKFEIIVVEQKGNVSEKVIKKLNSKRIKYFHINSVGPSASRNFGIKKSNTDVILFCDDDCIVSKHWVRNIVNNFKSNSDAVGVYGQVKPYLATKIKGMSCVSCTNYKRKLIISSPSKRKQVFQGNAMAFRKEVFINHGFFKEWLGFGTLGMCTEDEEYAFSLLKSGKSLMIDPSVVSFHDHWVSNHNKQKILRIYSGGFFAAFSFHAFLGDKIALRYLKDELNVRYAKYFSRLHEAIAGLRPIVFLQILYKLGMEFIASYRDMKGVAVGGYYVFLTKFLKSK